MALLIFYSVLLLNAVFGEDTDHGSKFSNNIDKINARMISFSLTVE